MESKMNNKVHFIWGEPALSKKRIKLLKMNGIKHIYVHDRNLKTIVKEKNDAVYFSKKGASLLDKGMPESVHHFFIHVPPGRKKRGGK